MRTVVMLFTRDLRVRDHPALAAACAEAERVVPLFVFDDAALATPIASANKLAFLLASLRDLSSTLRKLGGALIKRRGDVAHEVGRVVDETRADAVFLSEDVTWFAARRLAALRDALPVEVRTFPGVTVIPPGALMTSSGRHYQVFTPYWRQWQQVTPRAPAPLPERLVVPSTLTPGRLPALGDLTSATPSPHLVPGGETAGRALLDRWLDEGVAGYDDDRDALAKDTSRLSPYLHLGCVSPLEVVASADRRRRGVEAFVRQVCWRDFHHQVLDGRPEAAWRDHHDLGDRWDVDAAHLQAWKAGRTGYPIVDAGMRQLLDEGWMHNRARLIVGSFLTRDLYIDWRAGARHFLDHLVDGDIANNQMNWQWVAGTGTTSRRNRVFNPMRQAERYDAEGEYVRRHVPELAAVAGAAVHRPWALPGDVRRTLDYPDPIVDHDHAATRFLDARRRISRGSALRRA